MAGYFPGARIAGSILLAYGRDKLTIKIAAHNSVRQCRQFEVENMKRTLVLTVVPMIAWPCSAKDEATFPTDDEINFLLTHSPQTNHRALTNADVLEMLKARLSQDVVIAKIKSSNTTFDTSPEALKQLKAANVPDAVILAMVQAPIAVEKPIRTAVITCPSATEIPLFSSPSDVSAARTPLAQLKCGEKLSILGEGSWDKVRTDDGAVGYISSFFVPGEISSPSSTTSSGSTISSSASTSDMLPSNVLRAIAWRAIPWVTTSYYQQLGTANADCTGSGTWSGNIWQGSSSCTIQYTPAQNVPVNWYHFTVYKLVETTESMLVIVCTRNWAFSRCVHLVPDNTFPFEYRKGQIAVTGQKTGKNKEQTLEFDIVSSEPKTGR